MLNSEIVQTKPIKSFRLHIRETAQLAFPVIVGQLGIILMGVVDNAMVGRIGYHPLAASALANGIFFLIFVVGMGVTYAVSPLVANSIGSGRAEQCGNILKQALAINIFIGIILGIITYYSAELFYLMHQKEKVVAYAIPYLHILAFSIPMMMAFLTYKHFLEGLSIMRPAMIIVLLANLVNVAGNYCLIYGNFGFPKLELNGAGISTLSSRFFMMIMLIIFLNKNHRVKKYRPHLLHYKIDWKLTKEILALGLPSGMQYFFEVGAFFFTAIMIGWFGARQLAAHQIALSIASITYMIVVGVSAAAAIRVAKFVGEGNKVETRKAGLSALLLAAGFMSLCGILFFMTNNILPELYISNVEVKTIAASLILIAAFFQIFDGIQCVGLGILRGISDVTFPTAVTFIAYWLVGIPLGAWLAFYAGLTVQGIWIGLSVGLATSASLLSFRFMRKTKKMMTEN
ncbi:MAG: MATE family efflux transporter [Ignavibacteriaceae bacterium]|jgi:MATE family multidrug resistance protein